MPDIVVKSPMQYLDKATSGPARSRASCRRRSRTRRSTGSWRRSPTSTRTGSRSSPARSGQASVFNEVVREQTQAMEIGERYQRDHRGLQLDPRRREEDGRPDRRREDRPLRARQQRLDEDLARRHRRPLRQDQGDLSRRDPLDQGPDRARADHPRRLPGFPRRAEAGRGDGARGAARRPRRSSRRPRRTLAQGLRRGRQLQGHGARRARAPRARPRRAAAPHPGRGEALPDRQGPLGQPDRRLQHLRGHHGPADADDQRQGARLRAGGLASSRPTTRC